MSGAVLTADEMRAAEQALFDAGTDPYALMCRAGEGAADIIWRAGHKRDALVLCGPGNNGGDGYVIARVLRDRGVPVRVAAMSEPKTPSSVRARADWGGPVEDIMDCAPASQLIDALFGIGLRRGLSPELADRLGNLVEAAGHSYAIDVPSGVDSDRALALSPVPRFGLCITMGAWKPAHVLMPARGFASQYVLLEIGTGAPQEAAWVMPVPQFEAPSADAHKYTRGLVAVVVGAMPGAAALSAEAAARGGAGYVRLLTDDRMSSVSHAIVRSPVLDFAKAKAVLVGPGLGREDTGWARLGAALQSGLPTVVDADGLWLLGTHGLSGLPAPAIVTPHEGEFGQLFDEVEGLNKIERTRAAAARLGSVVVHKGPDTVIAAPDGRVVVALPASPWLSTAGTGDVLGGLCAARLAVTGDTFRAAQEAVWLHGEAARRSGPAFIADDLLSHIGAAMGSRL